MRISFLFLVLLAGCAKPNYSTSNGNGGVTLGKPTACQARFASHLCAGINWEKYPTDTEPGSFLFKIFRPNLADGSPVVQDPQGEITVKLWMPGMGHGSSPVTVEKLDVGTYRATQVFFIMRGEWDIHVEVKVRNELKDEAILPITF